MSNERPRKEKINWKIYDGWSKHEQVGYNQAVSDCNAYFISRLEEILYAHKVVPLAYAEEGLLQIVNEIKRLRTELRGAEA